MRLIYLSPVPWHSFSQRPHELVRYFHARTGGRVLWVEPYPGRFPTLSDFMTPRPTTGGKDCEIPAWLTMIQPRALPIEPLPFSTTINRLFWDEIESEVGRFTDDSTVLGIGKPTTLALQLLQKKDWRRFILRCHGQLSGFLSGLVPPSDDEPGTQGDKKRVNHFGIVFRARRPVATPGQRRAPRDERLRSGSAAPMPNLGCASGRPTPDNWLRGDHWGLVRLGTRHCVGEIEFKN